MTENTLAETLANQLRRDILRGKLAPGAPVKERDHAAELSVSRTPMREAIRILAKEGLLILRPSRSPIVAAPSLEEITNAIDVLAALEALSGELACDRATEDEIAEIRVQQQRMAELYGKIDRIELFEMDMRIHSLIVAASHNPALQETHQAYLQRLWRARYLSASRKDSRERVLRQHGEIVEALEARDATAIKAAIHAHLEALVSNIREHFSSDPQFGPVPAWAEAPRTDNTI
ncbi:MAG: GntR family transcriptional regulator [Roseivivax sp.]|nr:GntR family transcriptional regulator [Roseivivax sp.]